MTTRSAKDGTQFPRSSCPAQAGHPVHTDVSAITGSSAFADDDSKEIVEASCLIFLAKGARVLRTPMSTENESVQANRAISTGKLNALPRLHTRPINVVVYHGSQGRTRFEVGFPLRCFQRLSRPYIATQHCGWRHNSSTRGTSIPVLSY